MTDEPIVSDGPGKPVVCGTCGQTHQRCAAHSRASGGGPCGRLATTGSRVCQVHGAAAPQVRAAAARRVAAAELEKTLTTYGQPREVNPIQAMVELLHYSAGHVTYLREQIQAEDPGALIWGVADEVDKGSGEFPGVDVRKAAAPSVWLQRYDVERRLMLDVSRDLAKLGIEWEDREAIRRQGAALARVVRETARLLGHDPNDAAVGRAFSSALRAVLGAGVDVDRVLEGRLA